WLTRRASRTSRRKRSTALASGPSPSSSVLSATTSPTIVSTARYTAPIPPRPSSRSIRYRPATTWPATGAGFAGFGWTPESALSAVRITVRSSSSFVGFPDTSFESPLSARKPPDREVEEDETQEPDQRRPPVLLLESSSLGMCDEDRRRKK